MKCQKETKASLSSKLCFILFIIILAIVVLYLVVAKTIGHQISYHHDDAPPKPQTITNDQISEDEPPKDDNKTTIIPTVVYDRDAVTVTAQNLVENADEFLLLLDISNDRSNSINININQLFINNCHLSKPLTITASANKNITGQITIAKEKLREYDISNINLIDMAVSVSSPNAKDNLEPEFVKIPTSKSDTNQKQDFIEGKNIYNQNNIKINAKSCQNSYCFRITNNNKSTYAIILKRIKINGVEQKVASLIEVNSLHKGLIKYQPVKSTDKVAVEFIIYENGQNNYISTGFIKIN